MISTPQVLLFEVDRVPAVLRPAVAGRGLFVLGEVIIHRKLLAFADPTQAHVEDMALHDARDQVGAAAMVDVLRAASADRSVQYPIPVEREVIRAVAMPALLAGNRADPFARIFDYFAIGRNRFRRVNSPAVNAGL